MGSPLAPLLANWFVASQENSLLTINSEPKPFFYARYVDDIFVLMKNDNNLNSFYYAMNILHSNLTYILKKTC